MYTFKSSKETKITPSFRLLKQSWQQRCQQQQPSFDSQISVIVRDYEKKPEGELGETDKRMTSESLISIGKRKLIMRQSGTGFSDCFYIVCHFNTSVGNQRRAETTTDKIPTSMGCSITQKWVGFKNMNHVSITWRYSYNCREFGAKEVCTWIFVYYWFWSVSAPVYY